MGNTILLSSRKIPSLLMLVMNCSASGEQLLSVYEVCGHLLSQLLFFMIVIFCCIVVCDIRPEWIKMQIQHIRNFSSEPSELAILKE